MWRVLTVVVVSGCGSQLSVDVTELDFGRVSACSVETRSLSLRNRGGEPITVTLSDVEGFTVSPTGPLTVKPHVVTRVDVSFDGSKTDGATEQTLILREDDEATARVTLTATGGHREFTLSVITFGEVAVGDTLSSRLPRPRGMISTFTEHAFSADIDDASTWILRFQPTEARSYSLALTAKPDNACPDSISLTGVGIDALRAAPLELISDGGLAQGTVTFLNYSTREVELLNIEATSEFALQSTELTLPPAARSDGGLAASSTPFIVTWTPSDGGVTSALTMDTTVGAQNRFTVPIRATAP